MILSFRKFADHSGLDKDRSKSSIDIKIQIGNGDEKAARVIELWNEIKFQSKIHLLGYIAFQGPSGIQGELSIDE